MSDIHFYDQKFIRRGAFSASKKVSLVVRVGRLMDQITTLTSISLFWSAYLPSFRKWLDYGKVSSN